MHIRGAIHAHSTLSHDGTMPVGELIAFYAQKGYQFLGISEHAEDMDEEKVSTLVEQCAIHTTPYFCAIPGLEFVCRNGIHITGIGVTRLIQEKDPAAAALEMRRQGGFAVLAHPKRIGWRCPENVLRAVSAAEIWNVGYDGKFVPPVEALSSFARMKHANPDLLAIAGHDLHKKPAFYDVALEMDVESLSRQPILENLREGRYAIRSPLFRSGPQFRVSTAKAASVRLLGWPIRNARKARSFFLRWSA